MSVTTVHDLVTQCVVHTEDDDLVELLVSGPVDQLLDLCCGALIGGDLGVRRPLGSGSFFSLEDFGLLHGNGLVHKVARKHFAAQYD